MFFPSEKMHKMDLHWSTYKSFFHSDPQMKMYNALPFYASLYF